MKKLAIITTHPIQYNAPLFRKITERNGMTCRVFYTWGQLENEKKYDPGFGKNIDWDLDLLSGYDFQFLKNISTEPGSHHFKGIDNPTLKDEIQNWQPDALLIFGWSFKSHLAVMRYFSGKMRVLFRGDSTLLDEPDGFSMKKFMRRIALKWIFTKVDKALYVGEANKEYFLKHGLKDKQLIFAPHSIDNDRFSYQAELNWRKVLKIPGEAIVFLFCGKFEAKKNPGILIKAFLQLDHPDTHLLFVGNGVLEGELKKQVSQANESIQKRIHFLGFQNQSVMPSVYQAADIFVLPSVGPGETWGLSVNEAMASGLAVIISDKCGCAADLVKPGYNGEIVVSNSESDLTTKMKKFIDDRALIEKMQISSKEMIASWSYDHIVDAIELSLKD